MNKDISAVSPALLTSASIQAAQQRNQIRTAQDRKFFKSIEGCTVMPPAAAGTKMLENRLPKKCCFFFFIITYYCKLFKFF